MAQIGSLGLALASGRVYVGTTLTNGSSAFGQYAPATINGMLDAKAVTNPGVVSGLLIPNTNPGQSMATKWLDTIQKAQIGGLVPDYGPRLFNIVVPEQTK